MLAGGVHGWSEFDRLAACDKALWKEFPEFHKQVMGMQKRFRAY